MLTSVTGQDSSISRHLHATKRVLQDMILNADVVNTTADKAEVDDLERDAVEILRLIKSLRNRFTPVNRIPPEVLTFIPDFLDTRSRDRNVIALSHVCRAWREMFISRSSLWSNLDCVDADKTRVYLQRSGTSPINLRLRGGLSRSSLHTFLEIIPRAIGQLKSLTIVPDLRSIVAHFIIPYLSHPAPLLEKLDVDGRHSNSQNYPVLASTIFNGDLSSLRELRLQCVRTELPWRNMKSLTSFMLDSTSVGNFGQLLDFFETAPHLREIGLFFTTLISGGESGRLVPLDHLEKMKTIGCGPTSILLDHLVVPVGAKLVLWPDTANFILEDHIPRSLDNLKNLSSIAEIDLHLDGFQARFLRLSGPDGRLCMIFTENNISPSLVIKSLPRFDTSKTKRLRVESDSRPLSRKLSYRALLPMKSLRTLVLSRCTGLSRAFIDVLNPNTSLSKEVVCPSLEELVFVLGLWGNEEEFDIQAVIEMAAARASRGVKLGTFRDHAELDLVDVLELRKHVLHVEFGSKLDPHEDGSDCSDWED